MTSKLNVLICWIRQMTSKLNVLICWIRQMTSKLKVVDMLDTTNDL